MQMSSNKRVTFKSKKVAFSGNEITLYSLDGETWSTRKDELIEIMNRHEDERKNFGGEIRGGQAAKDVAQKRRLERQDRAEKRKAKQEADKKAAQKKKSNSKAKVKPKVKTKAKSRSAAKNKPAPKKRASSAKVKRKTTAKKKKTA
ncbi:MAG: hypothetical protein R3A13_09445 [Bdellovibrionota bacterium]